MNCSAVEEKMARLGFALTERGPKGRHCMLCGNGIRPQEYRFELYARGMGIPSDTWCGLSCCLRCAPDVVPAKQSPGEIVGDRSDDVKD
jgi:hypothetical protein